MRIGLSAVLVAVLSLVPYAPASAKGIAAAERPIAGQYIVTLHADADVAAAAADLSVRHNAAVSKHFKHALKGFVAQMSRAQAEALANNPAVAMVEEDGIVTIQTTQSGATWGLDRIDQRALPLSGSYSYTANGTGVTAYVIDTGIRTTHVEFGNRASSGFTAVNDGNGTNDCNGHGTHVSGTIGGSTYGVAKNVKLVAVRVLDCAGSGTTSGVIAGVDWVTANHVSPAVANMSLGGSKSTTLDSAVANSIASGVTYGIAGGNSGVSACNSSPARVATAITVGATDSTDTKASWSNYGTCLDIFAPGVNITSSWGTSDTATNTISGTSMATPHVVGVSALYLSANPSATPAQVAAALVANATSGVVQSPGRGSPNLLLFTNY